MAHTVIEFLGFPNRVLVNLADANDLCQHLGERAENKGVVRACGNRPRNQSPRRVTQ